jgi:hypothetical protein
VSQFLEQLLDAAPIVSGLDCSDTVRPGSPEVGQLPSHGGNEVVELSVAGIELCSAEERGLGLQVIAELYLCATDVIVGGPVAVIAGEDRLDINQSVNSVALFKLGYRHSQSRVGLRLRLNRHHRNNREQAHQ